MTTDVEDVRRHVLHKRDRERSLRPEFADHMLAALDAGATPDYQALLVAAQWPDLPARVFHTAPRTAREAITAHGLRVSQPGTGTDAMPDPYGVYAGQTPGVYVGEHPDTRGMWSRWAEWDVWAVDATGLSWAPDPMNPRCWVIACDVPADRLTLHTEE